MNHLVGNRLEPGSEIIYVYPSLRAEQSEHEALQIPVMLQAATNLGNVFHLFKTSGMFQCEQIKKHKENRLYYVTQTLKWTWGKG